MTEKTYFFVYQRLRPQVHHIQQSYNYEASSKGCCSWISKSCSHFLCNFACFFYLDLTKDSTALLDDNTLNYCINWFLFCLFFLKLTAWRKNFDVLENAAKFTFRTIWDRSWESKYLFTKNIWLMTVSKIRILKISAIILNYSNK